MWRNDVDVDGLTEPAGDDAVAAEATPTPSITVSPQDGSSLVTLVGDIDGGLRDQASAVMTQVLARGLPVVVDLSRVTFIDSSGLAFVLQLHRLGVEDPAMTCTLRNPPALVLELLEMIGVLSEMRLEFRDADTVDPVGDADLEDLTPAPV